MLEPGRGLFTFLFTDIVGSTRRWEQFPAAMPAALVRHDAIVREMVESHGGTMVKTTGDGALAILTSAQEGLAAAIAIQRVFHQTDWGDIDPLTVRVALHTGEAIRHGGDYVGPAVNRAARLLAAGHGGQILLTEMVGIRVADQLPPGVALRDLGEHWLRACQGASSRIDDWDTMTAITF